MIYMRIVRVLVEYAASAVNRPFDYLIEAKKSADFINEDFYVIQSSIALGDYYYNSPKDYKEALAEYLKARNIAYKSDVSIDVDKIEQRINDMKLRMDSNEYWEIANKYEES